MTEEPSDKPTCTCGKVSKWVCQSPTLHYFYCESCKKEVLHSSPRPQETMFPWWHDGTRYAAQLDSYGNPLPNGGSGAGTGSGVPTVTPGQAPQSTTDWTDTLTPTVSRVMHLASGIEYLFVGFFAHHGVQHAKLENSNRSDYVTKANLRQLFQHVTPWSVLQVGDIVRQRPAGLIDYEVIEYNQQWDALRLLDILNGHYRMIPMRDSPMWEVVHRS